MPRPRILVTNDDGWDAPGLAALKALAEPLGEVYVVAPRDPHSYAGHRVTTASPLELTSTGPREFHLSGTPADCVRVALTELVPDIDWILSGINRGGNLGADIHSSGTVAAAREAALLGRPAIAISQYVRRDLALLWNCSAALAAPVLAQLMQSPPVPKEFWNINLPHLEPGIDPPVVHCDPDDQPLDVRFRRDGDVFHYAGTYIARPRTDGRDVASCFGGAVTVSRLRL
jgi:5'-nucleotidase